jgi:hypothetical protein
VRLVGVLFASSSVALLASASWLAACSSSDDVESAAGPADAAPSTPPDASPGDANGAHDAADAAPAKSPPPPWPLVTAQGGPVLTTPKLVTITFSDDPNVASIEGFGDWVVGSSWLASASEYGVGKGTHAKKVRLGVPAPATASSTDIRKIITDAMTAGDVPTPAGAADPFLYAVYFPSTTTLTSPGLVHCTSFSGYHAEGIVGTVHFAFAAIGDCPHYVGSFTELENIERTASHEIIEAATDPLIESAPSFVASDPSNPWYYLAGEVGDVCSISDVVRDGSFLGQRFWSNAAAKAGTDPCLPAPAGEYFATGASPAATQIVAPGASTTFALRGFSTAASASPWNIQVKPMLGTFTPKIALDVATMSAGASATLTVTVPVDATSGSYTLLAVYSYRTPSVFSRWPIAIRVK